MSEFGCIPPAVGQSDVDCPGWRVVVDFYHRQKAGETLLSTSTIKVQ